MKNLNESLLESIDLIQESQLESELDVIFAIGEQYAKVGLITEYASEEVVNEFGIIQESVFFQERATAPAGGEAAAAAKASGESIGSKIWTGIKKFFAMIGRAIKSAWEWIVGKAKDLGNWVKSWFQKKDKKGAKGSENKVAEVADKVKAAAESDASAEEAAKLAAEAAAAAEKAAKDAAEFGAIEKDADEFDEYGKLIEQLRNDPALKTNTATVLRKIYDILNKMSTRLSDVKGKSEGSIATTPGDATTSDDFDKDFDLLLSIAKTVYGKKVHKDKNLRKAFDAFQNQKNIKKLDVTSLFEGDQNVRNGRNVYLQTFEAVYDLTFLDSLAALPGKINKNTTDVKGINMTIDSLVKHRVYYFDLDVSDTKSRETEHEFQQKKLHKAIRECENFTSNSTNITDTPKELEAVAKRLESELMPHITNGTAEMLSYQRYITDVFAEFKKRVSSK